MVGESASLQCDVFFNSVCEPGQDDIPPVDEMWRARVGSIDMYGHETAYAHARVKDTDEGKLVTFLHALLT